MAFATERVIETLGNRAVHSHRPASGAKWDNRCATRLSVKDRRDLGRRRNQTATASLAIEATVKHLRVSEDTT